MSDTEEKVTLSLDKITWEKFKRYCATNAFKISSKVGMLMEDEIERGPKTKSLIDMFKDIINKEKEAMDHATLEIYEQKPRRLLEKEGTPNEAEATFMESIGKLTDVPAARSRVGNVAAAKLEDPISVASEPSVYASQEEAFPELKVEMSTSGRVGSAEEPKRPVPISNSSEQPTVALSEAPPLAASTRPNISTNLDPKMLKSNLKTPSIDELMQKKG